MLKKLAGWLQTGPAVTDSPQPGGIQSALALTGQSLMGRIAGLVRDAVGSGAALDADAIEAIEETLIRADVGLETATAISDRLHTQRHALTSPQKVLDFIKAEFAAVLSPHAGAAPSLKVGVLNVFLVVGVNGAGKTTAIGKLAHRFTQAGRRVVIAAGDTFRAAAEDQLEIWAQRAGADFVASKTSDPAAVVFDGIEHARQSNADVLLIDTAGRLQNKINLMEELRKIMRVVERELPPDADLQSLLVLDATTGQNALRQAEVFKEAVQLNGVILTKLDGSAKGGVVLAVAREYHLPVLWIGTGEGIEDLQPFEAAAFLEALFDV